MRNHEAAICAVCFTLGTVAPWGLLIIGGVIGLFTDSPYWGETAAWLCALGIAGLGLSYMFARFVNHLPDDQG